MNFHRKIMKNQWVLKSQQRTRLRRTSSPTQRPPSCAPRSRSCGFRWSTGRRCTLPDRRSEPYTRYSVSGVWVGFTISACFPPKGPWNLPRIAPLILALTGGLPEGCRVSRMLDAASCGYSSNGTDSTEKSEHTCAHLR